MTTNFVKKILSVLLCLSLIGCSEQRSVKMLNVKKTDLDDLSIIMLDLYNNVKDGQELSVPATVQRIKSSYSIRYIYDSEGFCECKCRKGKEDVISVRCANLGCWKNSWDVILCENWKKGSGIRDSRIVLCKRLGDKLQIYKVIYLRTRYSEHDCSTPVFDNYDNIYYLTSYDVQDFATLAGVCSADISVIRKEGFPIHWNSCRAVYNISTDTSKIFSITLNPSIKFCPELQKILPFVSALEKNEQYCIDNANIPEFLRQFKKGSLRSKKKRVIKSQSMIITPDSVPSVDGNTIYDLEEENKKEKEED